jgi:hypothetical protein
LRQRWGACGADAERGDGRAWLPDCREQGGKFAVLGWADRGAALGAYAGHQDASRGARAMSSTGTYVRAGLPEVATALAVLAGEPHPSRRKEHTPTSTTKHTHGPSSLEAATEVELGAQEKLEALAGDAD